MNPLGILLAALLWGLAYFHVRYPARLFRFQNALVGRHVRMSGTGQAVYRGTGAFFALLGVLLVALTL
ncbi:hypothetical protein [Haloarchaeobius sp. TZWWS8]|uniref:hypothetical protein n=1 Tax=Haloarchaeobius sp. TZWWS8 TaxID=3446121 RepID=UPI003EB9225F